MSECPVDLGQCKVYCNDSQIYPAMKYYIEDGGMSIKASARKVSKETGGVVTPGAAHKAYTRRTKGVTYVTPVKTERKTCTIFDLEKLIEAGKKFSTICADPPWKYSNQATRSSTSNHYETMTISDIANLPIEDLAEGWTKPHKI